MMPSGLDRANAHPEPPFDLPQEPGGELLVRRVLLFDHFENFIMDAGEQVQELTVVHCPPPGRPAMLARPAGQIVDGLSQLKKRPVGRFSLRDAPSQTSWCSTSVTSVVWW